MILLQYQNFVMLIGSLFVLDWFFFLPLFKVSFSPRDSNGRNGIKNSVFLYGLATVWLLSLISFMSALPLARLIGAGVLTLIFHHYFIALRWKSVRRGFGAPGFMAHWTIRFFFLVELLRCFQPSGELVRLFLFVIQWDFGWIMICAGVYKLLVGYLKNNGMEFGKVNPFWGYHASRLGNEVQGTILPRIENYFACLVEIAAGTCMIIPVPTLQMVGAVAIMVRFIYVAFFIRLGRLSFLMTCIPFFYFPQVGKTILTSEAAFHLSAPEWLLATLKICMLLYVMIVPVIKIMQYSNLFLDKKFPEPLQHWFTQFANRVPIIIWRVFTPDVTDFYVRIWGADAQGVKQELLVDEKTYGLANWGRPLFKLRMLHVSESIAITSVFTTLKYFPSDRNLFERKLIRYTDSLAVDLKDVYSRFCFEYVKIVKFNLKFEMVPIADFWVDLISRQVSQKNWQAEFDFSKPAQFSPVRESMSPGNWLPKKN